MNKIKLAIAGLSLLLCNTLSCFADGCWLSPYDDVKSKIISLISGAKEKIKVCVYAINDPQIIDALVKAHQDGVVVEVLTDLSQSRMVNQVTAIQTLTRAGIPVTIGNSSHGALMHAKFMVVDELITAEGSYNYTTQAPKQDNTLVVYTNPDVALQFELYWSMIKADMK